MLILAWADMGHAATWISSSHPCPGLNRTDALHRDTNGMLWVGCGTNTVGYGLFYSQDGGASWAAAPVTPADTFSAFRVNSISRASDGRLVVAGFNASTRDMVFGLVTQSTPFVASLVLRGVPQVGRQFHVGTYRELSDGRSIAESLNGTDLLYRANTGSGSSAADWTALSSGRQMLDMVVHNNQFYGSGSTIAEPPTVFLPPTNGAAAPTSFVQLEPMRSGTWTGELWGIAASAQRVVAVGVDQDNDEGKIFVSGANPYQAAGYTEISMSSIVGSSGIGTWARGVCMQGDRVAVVGERQPLGNGTGRVMLSVNGGQSFQNITPAGVTATVSKCLFEPDGSLVVAGADGFIGIYVLDSLIFRSGFENN